MSRESELLARITQTPGKCGGKPCVRDLRIRVRDVLESLAAGASSEELLKDFPELEQDDIYACLLFAARRTDFPGLAA